MDTCWAAIIIIFCVSIIFALILSYQRESELREIVEDASKKLSEFGEQVKSSVEYAYADFCDECKKIKEEVEDTYEETKEEVNNAYETLSE